MPTILFSCSRGRNPAWFLLALVISPLLAALLLALPNLQTSMATIYSGGYRLVSAPQLEGSRPHVDIRRRGPNSRPDRLLDSSACAGTTPIPLNAC
jgi:hypothetical protein